MENSRDHPVVPARPAARAEAPAGSRSPATCTSARPKWSSRATAWTFLVGCIVASIIRLTIKDRWPPTAFLYYGSQPVIIAAAAAIAALGASSARYRRMTRVSLLIGVTWLAYWVVRDWRFRDRPAPAAADSTVRVVHWNLAHGRFGWPAMVDHIVRQRPDVVALSEAWSGRVRLKDLTTALGPGYSLTQLRHELALIVRGDVIESRDGRVESGLSFKDSRVRVDGRDWRILQIDLPSTFTASRAESLALIDSLTRRQTGEPLLLVGDFNLPPDSILFDRLRAHMSCAFDAGGRGYRATWPVPIPFLALDQMWVNRRVRVHDFFSDSTARSDHRLIVADVAIQ